MLTRSLAGLVCLFVAGGLLMAEETRGTITKIEDGSITIRTGGFRKDKEKSEEKTFKISPSVKISRVAGKDKEEVKLTLAELKTAVKVTGVSVTITHEGDNGTEIKVGGRTGRGKGKSKDTN